MGSFVGLNFHSIHIRMDFRSNTFAVQGQGVNFLFLGQNIHGKLLRSSMKFSPVNFPRLRYSQLYLPIAVFASSVTCTVIFTDDTMLRVSTSCNGASSFSLILYVDCLKDTVATGCKVKAS